MGRLSQLSMPEAMVLNKIDGTLGSNLCINTTPFLTMNRAKSDLSLPNLRLKWVYTTGKSSSISH